MSSLCRSTVIMLALLNLLTAFVLYDLKYYIFCIALIVLMTGLPLMGPGFRNITVIFGLTGSLMLAYSGQSLAVWITGLNSMTNVISILTIMSMFAVPMEAGKYDLAVQYWINRSVKSEKALFLLTTIIVHFFASFMLFGTIPVVVSLLGGVLKQSVTHYERFMSTAASRGYALVTLWAPGAINLFLVIQATGVKWLDLFVPGVILSLIGIAISYSLELKRHQVSEVASGNQSVKEVQMDEREAGYKALTIVFAVIGLVALAVTFEKLSFGFSSSHRIMTAGAIIIFIWATITVRQPGFRPSLRNFWNGGILKTIDLAPLFLSMGIFSKAVESSGVLGVVQLQVQGIASDLGFFSIVILPMLLILTALVGIHPFISIVLAGQVVMSLHLPVTSLTIALSLALGGSISYMVSPFAGMILTLAKYLDCKTVDVALHWNWHFCLLYYAVAIVFVLLWGWYFGS